MAKRGCPNVIMGQVVKSTSILNVDIPYRYADM